MKPLWIELSALADKLAMSNACTKSELRLLRSSVTQMQNWFYGGKQARLERDTLAEVLQNAAVFTAGNSYLGVMRQASHGHHDQAQIMNELRASCAAP
jgi:hypothetical protein